MDAQGHTDTAQLSILTLGPPLVTMNGKLVKINRREQRAGLYLLACSPEPISRAEICEMFWPRDTEKAARKKLREGLSRLRTDLNDTEIIKSDNDSVALDKSRIYVDLHEYNSIVTPILNSSIMNGNVRLPDWCYSQLRKAISLFRSNLFLEGIRIPDSTGFENWVTYINHTLSFSREKIIQRLIDHCIAIGDIDVAILWLEKAIHADPFNTDLNFLLLDCLKESGRFKEANEYYSYLESLFRSSQYEELPKVLQDFKGRLQGIQSPPKHYVEEWPGAEPNAVPFVGRDDLIIRLFNAYHRKGIIYVTGESGAGKNRLVQEFYSRLDYKPRLLFCVGKPMVSSSPFAPIIDGLRSLVTPREWSNLPQFVISELAYLFPELNPETTEEIPFPPEMPANAPLQKIFTALEFLLIRLTEKKPLLFVIDIAPWCDDATIEFLTFLNEKQFFKHHGLLILIGRKEDRNPVFEIFIDRSILANNLEKINLQPITPEDTAQIISFVFGREVSQELVNKIQTSTGGNPFFLIETLKAINLVNLDTAHFSNIDLYPVPPTIQSMVNEKVRILSDDAKKVLYSAAVLGQRFLPEVLESMVGTQGSEVISALEELQSASILIAESGLKTLSQYEFPHDQIREVVLQALSPARKRNLHLAAVKAIQEYKGDSPELASIFAYHFEQAGEMVKAFEAWCAAGRFARSRFSRDDTYAAYQRARDLLPLLPTGESSTLLHQLLAEWGDYAYDLNDVFTCEMLYKTGLEFAEASQDALLIGMALNGLGRVAEMRGEFDDGIELHCRALFFYSKSNAKGEKLEAYARLGILYVLKDDYLRAKETFLTGLNFDKDYSDKLAIDAVVNLQTQLSMLYSLMGWPAQAETMANQAVNDSQLVSRQSAKVEAYTVLAMAQYYAGKYKKSIQNAAHVYKLAVQLNLEWWTPMLDLICARDYLIMGQLDESWFHVHRSFEIQSQDLSPNLVSLGNAVKGDIFRLLGALSSAEEQYRLGSQASKTGFQSLENYYLLGLTQCQKGQVAEGVKIMGEVIEKTEQQGLGSISLIARILQSAYSITEMHENQFLEETRPIIRLLKERGFGSGWLNAEQIAGNLALQRGDATRAIKILREGAEFAGNVDNRWNELWALSSLAGIKNQDEGDHRYFLEKVRNILDDMADHATKPPISALFKQFRKNLEVSF